MKRLAVGTGVAAVLVLLVIVALVLWLNSDTGRNTIERYARGALAQTGLTLAVEDFEADFPFRVSVGELEIGQDDGVVLSAEKLRLRWKPLFLLAGRLHIEALLAEAIRLERMPTETVADTEDRDRDLADLPGWLDSLSVERLDITRLEVGEAIAGERGAWHIYGEVGISDGDLERTHLDILRIDDRSDRFVADIAYRRDERSLRLDMSWHEAPGGAIAKWIGLPEHAAIDVEVTGDGRAENWRGRIFGHFGEGTTELSVSAQGRDRTRLSVSGNLDLRALVPERYSALASGRLDLEATARQRKRYRVIKLARFTYANESLDVTATGSLDRKNGKFTGEARLLQSTSDGVTELLAPVKTDDLAVSLSLLGSIEAPSLTIAAQAGQLAVGGVEAADVDLRGELAVANGPGGRNYRFAAHAGTVDLGWDLEGMDRLVRGPATADLHGVIEGNSLLTVENLDVLLPDARVAGPVELNLQERTLRAPLKVTIKDLDSLDPLARVDLEGSAALDVDVYLPDFSGEVHIDTAGQVRDFGIGLPVLRSVVSPEMALTARLVTAPRTGLSISDILIEGEGSTTRGTVNFPHDYSRMEISAECRLPDASVVSPEIGVDVHGAGSVKAELTGPVGDPSVAGAIRVGGLNLPIGSWESVTGNFSLDHLVSGVQGALVFAGEGPPGATRVDSKISLQEQMLQLHDIRVQAPGVRAQGRIDVPYAGLPLAGRLEASIDDVGTLVSAYSSAVSSGRVDATLDLSDSEGLQRIRLTAIGQELQIRPGPSRPLRTERLEADVTLTGLDENAAIDGVVLAKQFTGPSSRLPTVEVDIGGRLVEPVIDFETKGTVLRSETTLSASLSMDFRDSMSRFRLARLSGSLGEMTIESNKSASLSISGKEYHLDDVDVALGSGFVTASARLGAPDAGLNLSVKALPLSLLRLLNPVLDLTGQLDTQLDLRTEEGQTTGTVDLRVTSAQLPDRRRSTPLSGTLEGKLLSGQLIFTITAEASLGDPVTVRGEIPLDVDLEAMRAGVRPTGDLNGRLEWSGEAYDLVSLFPLEDHVVRGPMSITLAMSGSPSDPRVSGELTLRDGRYEHLLAGTVLTPLVLHVEGDGRSLRLVQLTAGDGGSGSLRGEGRIVVDPESGFPLDARLEFRNLTLLRRDEITGRATGQLQASGPLEALKISGLITTEQLDVQLINNLPPQVVELEVTEIGDEIDTVNGSGVAGRDKRRLVNGDLDIRVELPGRIYVRGLGLDSEWQGKLDVEGPVHQPRIVGRLESRRGVLMFLGRRFRIEDSNLRFAGGRKVDPLLDVRAVYQGPELEVTVNLTGPISNPGLTLSSDPALPEDEILSRALFNKSTGELSAVEAVQLAAAVGELTVTGGGPGALARLREAVGVDVLRFGTTETTEGEQATTVEAGRYLAEGLYLGVETSTFEESGAVTVEYEVTRKIRLTTDLKQTGGKNIGIEYKRDY